MAPLRYHYTGDEDQLPVTPLNLEEESDSWWAGVQRCSVAIPIAGTLAAVALSASLAFGYQQQVDEIVEQPVLEVVEDEYWQVYTPSYPPAFLRLPYWHDEVDVLPPPPQLEEEYWQVYTPLYVPAYQKLPYWYDAAEILETFSTYETVLQYDATRYGAAVTVLFEVRMRSGAGAEVAARLFNVTDSTVVLGSIVTTTSTTPVRLRSGGLTLTGTKEYRAEIRQTQGETTTVSGSCLVVRQ